MSNQEDTIEQIEDKRKFLNFPGSSKSIFFVRNSAFSLVHAVPSSKR